MVGLRASLLGQPNLAFHADVIVRMHDLRRSDRRLVPGWGAVGIRAVNFPRHGQSKALSGAGVALS
jgi:hypothetical protein